MVKSRNKTIKNNFRGKSRNGSRSQRRGNVFRMVGKDLVNMLPETVVESCGYFGLISANPAYWKGTRIAAIASAYQSYSINRISFEYVPQVSVGYNGTVIMGTRWSNSMTSGQMQQSLYTSPGGKMTVVYKGITTNVPLTGLQMKKFNMAGDVGVTTNPFFFLAAIRGGYLSFQDQSANAVVPGYFVVHYDYSFYNPIGSGWDYDVQYAASLSDAIDRLHTSLVLLYDVPPYGAGTIVDYDSGQLSVQSTQVQFPQDTLFNVYSNGPRATTSDLSGTDVAVTGPIVYNITGVQVQLPDSAIIDLQPYSAGPQFAYRGAIGMSSAVLQMRPDSISNALGALYGLTAWHGIREWSMLGDELTTPVYLFQTNDLTAGAMFRTVNSAGRVSSWLPVSPIGIGSDGVQLTTSANQLYVRARGVELEIEPKDEGEMADELIPQPIIPNLDDLFPILREQPPPLPSTDGSLVRSESLSMIQGSGALLAGVSYLLAPRNWYALATPIYVVRPTEPYQLTENDVSKWCIYDTRGSKLNMDSLKTGYNGAFLFDPPTDAKLAISSVGNLSLTYVMFTSAQIEVGVPGNSIQWEQLSSGYSATSSGKNTVATPYKIELSSAGSGYHLVIDNVYAAVADAWNLRAAIVIESSE